MIALTLCHSYRRLHHVYEDRD